MALHVHWAAVATAGAPPQSPSGKTASPEGLWTAKIVDFGLSKVVAQKRQRALQRIFTRSASISRDLSGGGGMPRSDSLSGFWGSKLRGVQRSISSSSSAVSRAFSTSAAGASGDAPKGTPHGTDDAPGTTGPAGHGAAG